MSDPRPSVGIRTVPPLAGLRWIRLGFRAFGRQPGGFMGLFGMFLLAMIVFSVPLSLLMPLAQALQLSPVFVSLLGLVLMPLLSLGFMLGTEAVTNDLRVRPGLFLVPLRVSAQARRSLLAIGLGYVVVLCAAWFVGNGIDSGETRDWLIGRMVMPPDGAASATAAASAASAASDVVVAAPASDRGQFVLVLKMLVVALCSIPLWHAPALVHWGRQGAAKAMFASVVALWRTRAAFSVFLVGWFTVTFIASTLLELLDVAFQGSAVIFVFALLASLALSAVFYVTLWFGFVDTFEITPPDAPLVARRGTDNSAR